MIASGVADLSNEQAMHFRDLLREARSCVLRDLEAYETVVRVVEQMGWLLSTSQQRLVEFEPILRPLALKSALAEKVPAHHPNRNYHLSFTKLFHAVRRARNLAVHEGALARRMAGQVVELALVMEDALAEQLTSVAEMMVRNPVVAQPWYPLSLVRQTMLTNAFS